MKITILLVAALAVLALGHRSHQIETNLDGTEMTERFEMHSHYWAKFMGKAVMDRLLSAPIVPKVLEHLTDIIARCEENNSIDECSDPKQLDWLANNCHDPRFVKYVQEAFVDFLDGEDCDDLEEEFEKEIGENTQPECEGETADHSEITSTGIVNDEGVVIEAAPVVSTGPAVLAQFRNDKSILKKVKKAGKKAAKKAKKLAKSL